MKTTLAKPETTTHDWKIVDATDQILGVWPYPLPTPFGVGTNPPTRPRRHRRLCDRFECGKSKTDGSEGEQKKYMFYSGYMGNEKYRSVADFRAKRPEFIITNAVRGMLPKTNLPAPCSRNSRSMRGTNTPTKPSNPPLFYPNPNRIS